MTNDIKLILQEVIQLNLNGQLTEINQVTGIIDKHIPGELPYDRLVEITDYLQELVGCHNIPAIKAYAVKYDLTIEA